MSSDTVVRARIDSDTKERGDQGIAGHGLVGL